MKFLMLVMSFMFFGIQANANCLIHDSQNNKVVVRVITKGSAITAYSPTGRFLCVAYIHSSEELEQSGADAWIGQKRSFRGTDRSGDLNLKKGRVTFTDDSSSLVINKNLIIAEALNSAIAYFRNDVNSECTRAEAFVGGAGYVLGAYPNPSHKENVYSGPDDPR